jgi:rhodanese-related sulfurtransferase
MRAFTHASVRLVAHESTTSITAVSPAEAHAKMTTDGHVYVDVRTPDEFEEGHPEGAINVPLGDDFLAHMERRFAKDARIIVGCKSGGRSLRAANTLVAAGWTTVVNQRAGWDGTRGVFGELLEPGWKRVGLP